MTKPYHISVGGLSLRVRASYWDASDKNKAQCRKTCLFWNANPDYPREVPLMAIYVMADDNESNLVYWEKVAA